MSGFQILMGVIFWAFTVLCSVLAVRIFGDKDKESRELEEALAEHQQNFHQNTETIRMKTPEWEDGDTEETISISLGDHHYTDFATNMESVPPQEVVRLIVDHLDLRYSPKKTDTKIEPARLVKAKKLKKGKQK